MCLTSSFFRVLRLVIFSDFTNTVQTFIPVSGNATKCNFEVPLKLFALDCLSPFPSSSAQKWNCPQITLFNWICLRLVPRSEKEEYFSEPHADLQAHCDYIMFSLAGCTDSVDGTLPPNEWGCSPSGPLWPSESWFVILLSILITPSNR